MNPCAASACSLPDLLEARKDDIVLRWETRVSEALGAGLLPRAERLDSLPGLVDSLVDMLRHRNPAPAMTEARSIGGQHGLERYRSGIDIGAVVREYGILRDCIFEVLEEAGGAPSLAELRALNQALDVSVSDAVVQYAQEHERVLRATEAKLHEILDHAPATIYAKDAGGHYLFVNRSFEQVSGRSRREVVGHTDDELFPPEVARIFRESDRRVLETGKSFEFDEAVPRRDVPHVYHSLKFPLLDAEGHTSAVCGIATDVTEERRLQRERDELRDNLRRVITQLPVILWSIDARGNVTLTEGEGLRAIGVEPGQNLGLSIFDLYAHEPGMLALLRRALAGEAFTVEAELGGTWFMTRFSPVFGPDGQVVSVSGVSLDITERRRAEEVLRQSEMRYRLATLATSDVIYDWDFATDTIHWSDLAARQFRLPQADAPLETDLDWWAERIHPEDRERVAHGLHVLIGGGGELWTDEYRFLRGDGTWAIIQDRAHVVHDSAGLAVRMVGAMQDITGRREAEASAKRRAEFEQLLIGIVGHDLRNPLSAITMAATALLRMEEDERQRSVIKRILSSAGRATRMLRDVLDFTQARLGGGIPMQPRPLDLHELTRQVVDEVRLAHPERRLEVECGGDGRGMWDPDRLAQVITNLVNNALTYSPPHCPVRVRTHGTRDTVSLAVHNMGPPIPPELMPRLFEPMKRAERKETRDSHGLGLGLFIVKHIVDSHGGTLRVHSTEEDGTTFMLRLPRRLGPERSGSKGP